jgi:hypothetical protein
MAKLVAATITWTLAALAALVWNSVGFLLIYAFIYSENADRVPGFPDPSDAVSGALDLVRVAGSGIVFIIWVFGAALLVGIPLGLGTLFRWYHPPRR